MLEILFTPFFLRALLVGSLLGIVLAALGVFVSVRRLSFFSDAIGHSALTGIAIGLLLHLNPFLAALAFALLLAAVIAGLRPRTRLPIDTLLGVLFPASVALGVILVSLTPGYQTDLINFLFGDIITVGSFDIFTSLALLIAVAVTLILAGKSFVAITINADLARAEGIPVQRYELIFLLLLAAAVALSIKLVGIVLVTAMLVTPAAIAQNISSSLASLFGMSMIVGLISVLLGLALSALLNLPAGPVIVLVSSVFFLFSFFLKPSGKH